MGVETLISEIPGSVIDYQSNTKICHSYFYHFPPIIQISVSSRQTLAQIKSQEFSGHIKQHFMTTSPVAYVTNSIQDFVK